MGAGHVPFLLSALMMTLMLPRLMFCSVMDRSVESSLSLAPEGRCVHSFRRIIERQGL